MKPALAFISLCSAVTFTVGCNLSDLTGSGGSSDSGGVAERSAYSIVKSWDGQVATMEDGFKLIVVDGTFQRESCSYGGDVGQEFLTNISKGDLLFYKVYITGDFKPSEPMVANQATIVNVDCYKADPCTCGCANELQ